MRLVVLGIIRVVGSLLRMNVGSLRHRDGERRSPPPPPPPWLPATVLLLLFFVCACGGIDTQADRASCRYCAAKGTTAIKMADSPMLGHRHLDGDLDQHHWECKAALACRLRGGQGGEEGEGAEKGGEEGEGAEKGGGGGGGAIEEREGADEAEVEHDHGEEDGDICEDDVVMLSRVKAFMAANPGGFGTGKEMHVPMARLVSKLQARSREVKACNRRRAPLPSATDFMRGVEGVSEEFGPLPKLPEDRSAALGGGRAAAATAATLGGGLALSSSTRAGAMASLRSGLGSASGLSELERKRMAAHEAARNALLGDAFQSDVGGGGKADEDEDEESEDMSADTDNMLDQLGGAVNRFKSAATSNLHEIQKSMEVMENAAASILRNIPAVAGARTAVTKKFQEIAKSDRQMKMLRRAVMAVALIGFYVMMKVQG